MLDGSLNLSSVYTSLRTCELSFLCCYEKLVSTSLSVVPLDLEMKRFYFTKYCCGSFTFANRTAHLVNILCLVVFFLLWFLYGIRRESAVMTQNESRNGGRFPARGADLQPILLFTLWHT